MLKTTLVSAADRLLAWLMTCLWYIGIVACGDSSNNATTSTSAPPVFTGATLLEKEGCERLFKEQVSSVAERGQLEEAISFARAGDVFVVTKLDRLARNTQHLLDIVQRLDKKSVALKVLNLGLDTSTPTGKLMLTMLGAVGQFEREIMLERQREGVAKAKVEGKYTGRKLTARAMKPEVVARLAQGLM